MSDPNMSEFYRRVDRIQKARARGHGFEAPGVLGRSYYTRPQAQRRGFFGPVLVLLVAVFLLKGLMISQIGRMEYESRVERLLAGAGVERVGGWLMQVDPVSEMVAREVGTLLPPMR